MDESKDPLEESGGTHSDESDDEIDDYVIEDMQKFQDSFKGITRRYRLINRIGEGTFSTVYKAEDLHYDAYQNDWDVEAKENAKWSSPSSRRRMFAHRQKPHCVAIKKIYATSSPGRILNELELLHDLRDSTSVCPLITAFRHQDQVIAVLPYFQHRDFREYFRDFTISDMRHYFHSLFTALKAVHDHNILHRDIKPTNFLYSPTHARGVLVDFGLAERQGTDAHFCTCQLDPRDRQYAVQSSAYSNSLVDRGVTPATDTLVPAVPRSDARATRRANRAGTRGFRAPEVLLKCTAQTTAIDVWSAGVILLTLLTRRFPFFHSADDIDALIELATIFGKRRMREAALLHGQVFETSIPTVTEGGHGFQKLVLWCLGRPSGSERVAKGGAGLSKEELEAVTFMQECFELNPEKRITADQALAHPFIMKRGVGEEGEDEMDVVTT
ncbi:kinase-like protein [Viridothelium virens]|uniref:non-specific serine/threonine protein kinase n=1 Tax=Viridothelium virens TaxID=1048519 RepID=A0A6A6H4Z1_VIRVR|nr:kinase-like protein [Viridothelium virens]